MFAFIAPKDLPLLKNLKLVFQSTDAICDPFIINKRVHRSHQETRLSDSEFEQALKTVYENMEPHIKAMVSWEYYLQQAKQNKQKIEPTLVAAKSPSPQMANKQHYSKVGCLRLFPSLQLASLWESYGDQHKGLAVELDVEHEYFTGRKFEGQPQILKAVNYDDLRPALPSKQDPFPALFSRAEHFAWQQEVRLLRLLKVASQDEPMKVPKVVIKGLYLGLNCPLPLAEELAQLVKMDLQFRHVKLRQMAVSETHLRLQPMDLSEYL